jgi:hypothetical protein
MTLRQYLFEFTTERDKIDKAGLSEDPFEYAWQMLVILQRAINDSDLNRGQLKELINTMEDYGDDQEDSTCH